MKRRPWLWIVLLFVQAAYSQQGAYTAYTTAHGLPSNHVYQCVEDKQGFLWVSTDAGIARFDGKYFQVFTTQHGLPDNEVLQVATEKDGTVWINCFKQAPAYFDPIQNRFINAREDSNLSRVSGTANMRMFVLKDGGILYHNEHGSYVFKQKKLVRSMDYFLIEYRDDQYVVFRNTSLKPGGRLSSTFFQHSAGGQVDSLTLYDSISSLIYTGADEGKLYLFEAEARKARVFTKTSANTLRYRVDSFAIPEEFFAISFTPSSVYVITTTAKLYVFDKRSLRLKYSLAGDYLPNGFYEDRFGNLWVSTIDRGLLVYRSQRLGRIDLPDGLAGTNFISIARRQDGTLVAGNYYGQVLASRRGEGMVHNIVKKRPSRQKKILVSGPDIYTLSDASHGVYLNYSEPLVHPVTGKTTVGGKTGLVCNDSLALIGTTYGFLHLNTQSHKFTKVTRYKRVTAMANAGPNEVYFGSTDGLYRFNFVTGDFLPLAKQHPLFTERITALCITPDKILWVATAGKGLAAVFKDTVLFQITTAHGILSNSGRSLTTGRPGQVWLGTSSGISVIDYSLKDGRLNFIVRNLSVHDGLTSNEINEMVFYQDTLYAATGNGISVVPAGISLQNFQIPTRLIMMRINERDTAIKDHYELQENQRNFEMRFAGVELNGHFKNLQYSVDNGRWSELPENTLALQLGPGDHAIRVRSVDVNGTVSNKPLIIRFSIATPFWRSVWFWLGIALSLQLLTIYLVNKRQKKRKELKLASQLAMVQTASLEQQAFTSLMNPHFMFNALNSVQHYINVQDRRSANRYLSDFASLIRKNFEAAQRSFIPLEQELENIRIYLRLEQMRFADRFQYEMLVADDVDTDDWMIPTMMLQPLLENALLHGIMPSPIPGKIQIHISAESDRLLIDITDNGIGVAQSLAHKPVNGHKSHGMDLIRKRIRALGHFTPDGIAIDMKPAFPREQNPGNQIRLCISGSLYKAWMEAGQR